MNHSKCKGDTEVEIFSNDQLPKALAARAQQTPMCPVVWRPPMALWCSASNSKNSALGLPGALQRIKWHHLVWTETSGEKLGSLIISHMRNVILRTSNYNRGSQNSLTITITQRTFDSYRFPGFNPGDSSDQVGVWQPIFPNTFMPTILPLKDRNPTLSKEVLG